MSGLVLHCLGPPNIEQDGKPVHVERRKAVALLVYLAVTQRPHSRETLAALLWPDLSERQARTMLRHALTALHRAIGARWLTLAEDRVALPAQPDFWVDLLRFRSLLANAPPTTIHPCVVRSVHRRADRSGGSLPGRLPRRFFSA